MPVPRKVWLQTSVVMPAALARRRTHPAGATQPALMTSSKSIAFAALHESPPGTGQKVPLQQQFRQLWVVQETRRARRFHARILKPHVYAQISRAPRRCAFHINGAAGRR
jgi:hypothetical protein